jgi:hypothetical protein
MKYYVNKNAQTGTHSHGEHEGHVEGCTRMPDVDNRTFLGDFDTPQEALVKAKTIYSNSDGCYYCCGPIHTK